MNQNQNKLVRRQRKITPVQEKPTLQRRIKKPTLQRRKKIILKRRVKKPTLQKRRKPDVFFCANKNIKNRLPYPIECHANKTLQECCRKCTTPVLYNYWKEGVYFEISKELKNKTYMIGSTAEKNLQNYLTNITESF